MRIRSALLVVLMSGGLLGAAPVKAMDLDKLKVDAFKARVGFDTIPDIEDADVGVVADWGGILELLPSRESGWEPGTDAIMPTRPGVVLRKWHFRRGEGALTVKVFVFSAGPAGARNQLVTEATLNSLQFSPYVRGPGNLGHFSIMIPGEPMRDVAWVFHNVCVSIDTRDTGLSVEPLARSIQGYMERHVKQNVSQHLPQPDKVTVSKSPVRVGQEVEVQAGLKGATTPGRFRVDFTAPLDALDSVQQTPVSSRFRALRPGKFQVEVDVTDALTLLRATSQAQVEVEPVK